MKVKKLTLSAVFLAVALIIGVVENALPPILPPLPYAKLGLSNVVILLSLYSVGAPYSLIIMILKCVLISVFSGNVSAIMYSLPAGLAAFLTMLILIKLRVFSVPAISVFGALIHNFVQVAVAALVTSSDTVWALFPYLALFGAAAGLITGIIAYLLIKKLSVFDKVYR